jgi:hypothetical protein
MSRPEWICAPITHLYSDASHPHRFGTAVFRALAFEALALPFCHLGSSFHIIQDLAHFFHMEAGPEHC